MDRLQTLHRSGTSVWLDTLSRQILDDGTLDAHIAERSSTGVTCNPTIFATALRASAGYDDDITRLACGHAVGAREMYLTLALADVRAGARKLLHVYRTSAGRDGYVSFECTPDVADDSTATVIQAERVRRLVPEPNLMVKVPGTDAGFAAIEELTARGVNVNVTLLFAAARWEQAARAYQRGLRHRLDAGLPLADVHSVASVFISRIDARVEGLPGPDALPAGAAGVAQGRSIYGRAQQLFAGPEWDELARAGAHPQRLLWASTAPKNPTYRDVLYVEQLALPETIVTVPESILTAFADHGETGHACLDIAAANDIVRALRARGVDLEHIGVELLDAGLDAFARDYAQALADLRARTHDAPIHAGSAA
jgi:transaldolase